MSKKKEEKAVKDTNTANVPVSEPKTETKAEAKKPKGFTVIDANGKAVRTVETAEKAEALAKVYGGRVK